MEQLAATLEQQTPEAEGAEQSLIDRILGLKHLGRSIREIARAVNVPATNVHRIVSKAEQEAGEQTVPPPQEPLLAKLEQEKQRASEATATAQHTYWEAREQLREAEIALRAAEEALKHIPDSD